MTTTFPGATDSYTTKVDGVDDVLAADVNNPQDAIVAIQTSIFRMALAVQKIQILPGLVGFWPMSSIARDSGLAYDLSGQGRNLTYAGNPTFNILTPTTYAIPYIDFDGTGDYLTRADEAGLDITGGETLYASGVRGLTAGCWAKFDDDTPATANYIMTKAGGSPQNSYYMYLNTNGTVGAVITTDGSTAKTATTTGTTGTGWVFVAMRFVPSTSVDVYLGVGGALEKVSNTTSIPATIHAGTAPFNVSGFNNGSNLMSGLVALPFLCANQLSDEVIGFLFQNTRGLLGV
jgi:hypothetical protein